MARSIKAIQQQIWNGVLADAVLSAMLTSTSMAAAWWLWSWVVATVMQVQEGIFDAFLGVVNAIIATKKPHTLQWYVTKAKAFQNGAALPADSDVYDPVAAPGDVSLIVTQANAVEFTNLIRIKVAKGAVGALAALSSGELASFAAYMGRIKDAGVRVQCTSGAADNLRLGMTVYYDALVLDDMGARIDGTAATPVMDAVNSYLDTLPFDGVFVLNDLIVALRAVAGVRDVDVTYCRANYAATPYVDIIAAAPQHYTPDAGYIGLDGAYFAANVGYVAY